MEIIDRRNPHRSSPSSPKHVDINDSMNYFQIPLKDEHGEELPKRYYIPNYSRMQNFSPIGGSNKRREGNSLNNNNTRNMKSIHKKYMGTYNRTLSPRELRATTKNQFRTIDHTIERVSQSEKHSPNNLRLYRRKNEYTIQKMIRSTGGESLHLGLMSTSFCSSGGFSPTSSPTRKGVGNSHLSFELVGPGSYNLPFVTGAKTLNSTTHNSPAFSIAKATKNPRVVVTKSHIQVHTHIYIYIYI